VLIAMSAGLLVAAVLWGPVFLRTRAIFNEVQVVRPSRETQIAAVGRAIVMAPVQVFLDPDGSWSPAKSIPLALLVYVAPLLFFRRSPRVLFWWLWASCTIAVLAGQDLARGTILITIVRYIFILSPAVYAILATPLPGRLGILIPAVAFMCAMSFGIDRYGIGPQPTEDWRRLAQSLNRSAGPEDIVAIAGGYDRESANDYIILTHYLGRWRWPVIFLRQRPSDTIMRQLAKTGRVWVVGKDLSGDTARLFPGWRIVPEQGSPTGNTLWLLLAPSGDKKMEGI
jgi:hypothetical protein